MKILITGAGGFLGQMLAKELMNDSNHYLILTDVSAVAPPASLPHTERVTAIQADLYESSSVVVQPDIDAVYILHGIMSSGAEADFEMGFRVNFDATRNLLDQIKSKRPGIRVIYASSIAVYGRPFPDVITEGTYPTPEGSYGNEKLMCETMINDYTRRGYIDGFSIRLPGIAIRPGPPAQAASSFLSAIIREPLASRKCTVPTADRSSPFWVCSPKIAVLNLVRLLTIPSTCLPSHRRAINAPGSLVTIQEMRDALVKIAGEDRLKYVEEAADTRFGKLVQSWPHNFDVSLALSVGLFPAESFERAVEDYIQTLGV
ncbi:hypothetical protein PFICI_12031 [Pestalotiopsis fici W106-1]|uniref:NAD-dependent epimerase/dehydratase domain-containing protein n=1 Tax=Pestalotiopsis fici (strain W106-1 / CGMCC3.15140) TaxID=1229662 RepID=W3WS45_PESFW|nr:uncharacterized protein PFICI_12031 [Pestalotiopsis fici W106-1]ETS76644.1 hypothetical protein PFICI_12031 [Pestalotiopsis fici W106-1]